MVKYIYGNDVIIESKCGSCKFIYNMTQKQLKLEKIKNNNFNKK